MAVAGSSADQPLERRFVGIRPQVLVVGFRIRMHDEQLVTFVANSQGKRQLAQPRQPFFSPSSPRVHATCESCTAVASSSSPAIVAIGVAANTTRADLGKPLQHFLRLRSVEAKISGSHDRIGTALCQQIGQTRIQTDEISVDIRDYRDPHSVALER